MAKDNACDRGWIRHCGQDRRPLLPIQASFANAAQFFNSLLVVAINAFNYRSHIPIAILNRFVMPAVTDFPLAS
jgi:hypothetical protein